MCTNAPRTSHRRPISPKASFNPNIKLANAQSCNQSQNCRHQSARAGKGKSRVLRHRRRPPFLRPTLLPPLARPLAAAAAAAATSSSDLGVGDDLGHMRTVRSHPAVNTAKSVAATQDMPPLWQAPAPALLLRAAIPVERLPPVAPAVAPPPENFLLIAPVSQSHSCIDPSSLQE